MTRLTFRRIFQIGLFACIAPLGTLAPAETILEDITKPLVEGLPGFFGPQSYPTAPVPVTRALAEWEPAQMLLLSIPLQYTLNEPRTFAFYNALIEAGSRYVDIGILQGVDGGRLTGRFLKRLKDSGLSEEALARIHFIPSLADNFWVRDFGPIFALGPNGNLVAIDTIYRSLSDEKEAWDAIPNDIESNAVVNDIDGFLNSRLDQRRSEVTPIYVAKFLRQHYQYDCDLVRPPLYLQGGDYITDGEGRFFISQDTVLENGGHTRDLERIFASYFGAKELYTLNALPGVAAKHLDLLVCHPKTNTFILTEAPRMREGANLSHKRIVEEVRSVQKANLDYLRRNVPGADIHTLPMPPLLTEDARIVKTKARAQIYAYVCEEIGVDYAKYVRLPSGHSQRSLVQKRVEEHLAKTYGKPLNLRDDTDLSLATSRYLGESLEALIETNVDAGTVYRSYTNSLQIVTEQGQKVWLLPRYRPRSNETVEEFLAMEKEVERVYKQVDPDAILHWIDSDVMCEQMGAIHCVAMTIPRSDKLLRASKNLETLKTDR